jgi:hypothetical protein
MRQRLAATKRRRPRMTDIVFLSRLESLPERDTNIYRLKGPGVNERSLKEMARRFELRGDLESGELSKDADELTYTEGPFVVTLSRSSGALRYYDRTRWQLDDGESEVEFSDDQAVSIAEDFIRRSDLVPFADCRLLRISHLHGAVLERESNTYDERIIDVGVVFQRTIDNVPVEGAGGKMTVYVGHDRTITGVECIWREIADVYREVPFNQLRLPEYAENSLVRYWRRSRAARIEVTETRFGYYELGRDESQRYLQPAYVMPLTCIGPDERFVDLSTHVVAAASKPVGRLMPRRKVVPDQPPRRS